jgi:hypothetical protein
MAVWSSVLREKIRENLNCRLTLIEDCSRRQYQGSQSEMKMTRIQEILNNFKISCKHQGWKTSEDEDWVQTDEGFHSFLWTRDITPSSFKRVASERKCVIREGFAYRVVQASYTAWLFPQTPPEGLVSIITENSDFSGRTAVYDLSMLLEGEKMCPRTNNTESNVFKEFENFLKQKLHARFEQLPSHPAPETNTVDDEISQLA